MGKAGARRRRFKKQRKRFRPAGGTGISRQTQEAAKKRVIMKRKLRKAGVRVNPRTSTGKLKRLVAAL